MISGPSGPLSFNEEPTSGASGKPKINILKIPLHPPFNKGGEYFILLLTFELSALSYVLRSMPYAFCPLLPAPGPLPAE
jgi:hypothetical protein